MSLWYTIQLLLELDKVKLTEGPVVVSHDVGKRIRNIPTGDDLLGFARFVRQL